MLHQHSIYQLDDSLQRIDFATVHAWLTTSYWSPGISRQRIEQGARNSALVLGAYLNDSQVAFARVVSDTTRFAYLSDVFVAPDHRGKGLARALVQCAFNHPTFAAVDKWFLRTQDAHAVYQPLGFQPLADPESWMVYTPPAK